MAVYSVSAGAGMPIAAGKQICSILNRYRMQPQSIVNGLRKSRSMG
jgi:hypothetical protein